MELTYCELRDKEVINVVDGRRLGHIIDMTLLDSGKICGIVLPGERKLFKGFSSGDTIFIPWSNIMKIGDDAILVELICNTKIIPTPIR